jgi:3-keto-disaccharide hydrolase
MEVEMKRQSKLFLVLVVVALLGSWGCSQNAKSPANSAAREAASIKPFLGRWDLTVKTPTQERAAWIEISEKQGQAEGLMLGFGGHALPTDKIQVADGTIDIFPSSHLFGEGAEFKGTLTDGRLAGTATTPKGVTWQWTGQRAPSLERTGVPKWGKPIRLFNGRNLDGWKLRYPGPNAAWSVVHGTMVKNAKSSDIISTSEFEDFKLHAEFKCDGSCNSGVYLRGRYEVQVAEPVEGLPPNRSLGAIYGFIAPNPAATVRLGKWQSYDITLVGRTVTVVLDGKTIIDHQEIPGITGGALDSHEALPGPIYLQGGEHGQVAFRNIVITPAQQPS